MTYTPQHYSDPSNLVAGVHPAFLVAVTEEPIPDGWEMAKAHKFMYRWHFAVLDSVATMHHIQPEYQTAVSSPIFSAAGKQVSKAYAWMSAMLGRAIALNESLDTDALLPLPCQVLISRSDKAGQPSDYATIDSKLLGWPEGAALLTDDLKKKLTLWWHMKHAGNDEPAAPAPAAPAAPSPAPAPATRHAW